MSETTGPGGKPLSLHFGQVAIRHGFIQQGELRRCLAVQKQIVDSGREPMKLGDVMVEQGYITKEDTEKIFELQGREGGHSEIEGYVVGDMLGQGGMGTVYRAVQISMNRTVAIKVLNPIFANDRKYVMRFLREARASAWLNHQNIISGIDVGESNGLYYFAMEYVNGPTVQQMLDAQGSFQEKDALDVALQMARALEHAHQTGIVHRDLKPDNIILTADGLAKLLDLGIARQGYDVGKRTVVGTPQYISPEQARGDPDVDTRSDIYSLGVTLYHMVTGRRPFEGNAETLLRLHLQASPPSPRTFAPLSEECVLLIQKMMAKRREDRHANPQELATAIESALLAEPADMTGFEDLKPPPGMNRGTITAVPLVAPLIEKGPIADGRISIHSTRGGRSGRLGGSKRNGRRGSFSRRRGRSRSRRR